LPKTKIKPGNECRRKPQIWLGGGGGKRKSSGEEKAEDAAKRRGSSRTHKMKRSRRENYRRGEGEEKN